VQFHDRAYGYAVAITNKLTAQTNRFGWRQWIAHFVQPLMPALIICYLKHLKLLFGALILVVHKPWLKGFRRTNFAAKHVFNSEVAIAQRQSCYKSRKSWTDLNPNLFYISILGTYSKFVQKNEMLALGVGIPRPCSSAGRRFAESRSCLNYYWPNWWVSTVKNSLKCVFKWIRTFVRSKPNTTLK